MTGFVIGPSGRTDDDGAWAQPITENLEGSTARLALLLRASEALLSTDDPDEAVGRLAQVVVPDLADWSFITLVDDDGRLRDVGLAHRDPERAADFQAYSDCHLQYMSDEAAVSVGLRTGRTVIVPHLSDEVLARFLPDPAVSYLTRRLDPHGVAVFPLQHAGRTFGVLVSATTTPRGSHTPDELATLLEVSRRAGPVLGAARSARRARTVAETMQRSLLQIDPPAPGVDIAVRYRPAFSDREVGGDWYDAFTLADGSTVATIGDVMGHDLAAIAAMAQLRAFMRAHAWQAAHSPADVLRATDSVSHGVGPDTFATVLTVDLGVPAADGSVRLRWSNAGHHLPLVVSPGGEVSFLGAETRPDIPLGVSPDVPRVNHDLVLLPGTVLFLYTDGLIERRDRSLAARSAQLAATLAALPTHDLEGLLDGVLAAMIVEDTHDDDIALMAIRIAPAD